MKRAKRVERSEKHMLSFKMTTYFPYKVNLSEGQNKKLGKAFKANSALTLRLSGTQTSGNDELMLTANQKKRIAKAAALGKGVEIKISKSQIRKVMKQGGSLFSAIIPLARSLAPTLAKTLGLSALAGLASEGASQVAKKISGKGAMTGGFLIPQDKIQKLIDNKHLLTNKQKQEILTALQSGGQVVVKPSAKQSGGMLGTILASIGIPLALDMVKNLFGKGAPRVGRPKGKGAPRVGRPKGKGAPRLGAPFQRPPPFVGNWGRGMGKKKIKRRRTSAGIEKSIQQHPNSRSDFVSKAKPKPKFVNKPLTNFDLLQWVNFLKIPNFKGIFARDEIMPRKHSPCIINLDSLENAGTHWVCCMPGGRALWYFDSFGMGFPQEFKSSKPVIWNSSQLQNIRSVLCGYYCLYFLHQWAQGKDFYDILKPFSLTDTMQNEKFIKEYFY